MRLIHLFILFCCEASFLSAQQPLPFEAEIKAFERMDSMTKAKKGQIVLYGSSTIRLWHSSQKDLAGYTVINRGFGGSQMSDAIYYFDRVVLPLAPSLILLYEGDNDLSVGQKTPEQVFADFKVFMALVKEKLPGARVAVYSVRPSIAREHLMLQQKKLNNLYKKYCKRHKKRARFIDVYEKLLTPEGRPNAAYLDADTLHLNAKGYQLWAKETLIFLQKQ